MLALRVVHTADLDAAARGAARSLLEDAFAAGGGFADEDWEHCLGGLHVLAREDGVLVGHAAVVQRRLLHAGRPLRAGWVEGVAVRPDRRRRGVGGVLMAAVEDVVRRAYDLGGLSATDEAARLYAGRGWLPWQGPTSVLAPGGLRRTPEDDGGVHVLPGAAPLDRSAGLACDWRDGDVW